MVYTETLEEFSRQKFPQIADLQKETQDYNVFSLEDFLATTYEPGIRYARRDFYKICLITGDSLVHFADKTLQVTGSCLIFFNPKVPYKWEALSQNNTGYCCIFRDSFFIEKLRNKFCTLPMFVPGGRPFYILDEDQRQFAGGIFYKMLKEMKSNYKFKQDLLVSYVTELTYYALKIKASEYLYEQTNASRRIAAIFEELLEQQFPIVTPSQRFTLRSAKDYARQLYVHVNHLNRSIKETTGKTTSLLIAERMVAEAKALLKHTSWSISDISYCLGFEAPSHFNNFFKKHTSISPTTFRHL